MNLSLSSANPARLYALLLKLRPLEAGTLMPFSGELVHGAWLEWIRTAATDVSIALHDGNKRRLFTCSSLQFPLPRARLLEAERENVHLPVSQEKTYTIRITLLLAELFPLFYNTLMYFNMAGTGAKKLPFIQLGKREFLLEEVICSPDDPSGWTGFNWINRADKTYGNYFARLPLPRYVFPTLARRWHEVAPPELAHIVQKERIERYIEADGMIIEDYDLKTHEVQFTRHPQRGFVGSCTYQLRGPDEPAMPEAPLTVRQQIFLLAMFAFYCGIGYKTAMGMGQVRPFFIGQGADTGVQASQRAQEKGDDHDRGSE